MKDYLDDNGLDKIRQMENVVTLLFYVMSTYVSEQRAGLYDYGCANRRVNRLFKDHSCCANMTSIAVKNA